ncbi:hypothetical protein [Candidatus Bacteroides intestinigallinarum]|uniref:hypothetical protein n=1 Tax=Candidatus Bacteroides intestinigallinarum TaxID=2838470 RepID=UPI00216531DD|nr:hypothetical protein [Candidatus Bacteroides intestinigallinarum]MCS3202985.1 hypothetical protein [Candidatus Bacteroides intestinigallinarum]
MNINFKISTILGVVEQCGELIEYNGHQYALHYYEGMYKATELSTGFCVVSVDETTKTIDGISAKDYLIQQIKILTISPKILNRTKRKIMKYGLPYPLNPKINA